MSHTPGPWEWKGGYLQGGRKLICAGDVDGQCEPSNPDDANLIAAAPDLLAALRSLLAFCETRPNMEQFGATVMDGSEVQDAAIAAIAKAEGQS